MNLVRKLFLWLVVAALGVFAALPHAALAQEAKSIGSFGDWDAYTRGTAGNRFCYMVSKPKEASLRSRRGEIFFLVWHRPDQKEFDVVQLDIGYPFKKGSEAEIRVGSDSWLLFTREESAWTYERAHDKELVTALRKGYRLTVTGTSERNNLTRDDYSLKGTSAAYSAIGKACGRG
ncbi:MAG: invasion associated locus B family protein [Alphaproteobacteria bacterium]|nr:invasion associated locus B family protein [Alphaproteobacteria bacterium]